MEKLDLPNHRQYSIISIKVVLVYYQNRGKQQIHLSKVPEMQEFQKIDSLNFNDIINKLSTKTLLCIMIAPAVLLSNHNNLQMVFQNIFYALTKTYRLKDFTLVHPAAFLLLPPTI